MLHYDQTDVSEGINVHKTTVSIQYVICHYWYFLDEGFNFKPIVCNCCHDVLMTNEINSIAILNNHTVGYRCIVGIIDGISVSEAINSLKKKKKNSDFSIKSR